MFMAQLRRDCCLIPYNSKASGDQVRKVTRNCAQKPCLCSLQQHICANLDFFLHFIWKSSI